jgi:hypothetical protein
MIEPLRLGMVLKLGLLVVTDDDRAIGIAADFGSSPLVTDSAFPRILSNTVDPPTCPSKADFRATRPPGRTS